MRDPDGWTYFKEEVGGLVVGGFEPEAKPWRSPDDLPYPFEFQLLEEDWEHFSVLMDEALLRIPALEETGIRKFYNGPESFTPDNQFLLGEAPEVAGFFVGAGFNSVGIASAGGAGRALAEWIVAGEPQDDLVGGRRTPVRAVPRRQPLAAGPGRGGARPALRRAVAEPRARVGAAAAHLARARPAGRRGGVFGSRMGWERPNVFGPPGARLGRTPGASRPGCRGRPPSSGPPGPTSRSSTRRRSPSTSSPGRTRWPACSGSAPPTSTCRSAAASTRRSSTRAAPTRPT